MASGAPPLTPPAMSKIPLNDSSDREFQITEMLFSGILAPGAKVTERSLAENMGLSRIPAREVMAKLVTRGVLVRDEKNRSVRLRIYTPQEVLDLFQLREAIEVAAARLACRHASHADLLELEVICNLMEKEIESEEFSQWSNLDCQFHRTMVRCSHNARFIASFDSLIQECQFVFYRHPANWGLPIGKPQGAEAAPTKEEEKAAFLLKRRSQMRLLVEEHRNYLQLIREKDADGVQNLIRTRLQTLSEELVRLLLSRSLPGKIAKGGRGAPPRR